MVPKIIEIFESKIMTAPLSYLLITVKKNWLEMSLLVICKVWRPFVKILTTDDK